MRTSEVHFAKIISDAVAPRPEDSPRVYDTPRVRQAYLASTVSNPRDMCCGHYNVRGHRYGIVVRAGTEWETAGRNDGQILRRILVYPVVVDVNVKYWDVSFIFRSTAFLP